MNYDISEIREFNTTVLGSLSVFNTMKFRERDNETRLEAAEEALDFARNTYDVSDEAYKKAEKDYNAAKDAIMDFEIKYLPYINLLSEVENLEKLFGYYDTLSKKSSSQSEDERIENLLNEIYRKYENLKNFYSLFKNTGSKLIYDPDVKNKNDTSEIKSEDVSKVEDESVNEEEITAEKEEIDLGEYAKKISDDEMNEILVLVDHGRTEEEIFKNLSEKLGVSTEELITICNYKKQNSIKKEEQTNLEDASLAALAGSISKEQMDILMKSDNPDELAKAAHLKEKQLEEEKSVQEVTGPEKEEPIQKTTPVDTPTPVTQVSNKETQEQSIEIEPEGRKRPSRISVAGEKLKGLVDNYAGPAIFAASSVAAMILVATNPAVAFGLVGISGFGMLRHEQKKSKGH